MNSHLQPQFQARFDKLVEQSQEDLKNHPEALINLDYNDSISRMRELLNLSNEMNIHIVIDPYLHLGELESLTEGAV